MWVLRCSIWIGGFELFYGVGFYFFYCLGVRGLFICVCYVYVLI